MAELYSYTEGPEFLLNRKCFEEDFRIHGKTFPLERSPRWEWDGDLVEVMQGLLH